MKREQVSIKHWKTHPDYPTGVWVVRFKQGSKRIFRYFREKSKAARYADQKRIELANDGSRHSEISTVERNAILEARTIAQKLLEEGVAGFSIISAIHQYADHLRATAKSCNIEIAKTELLDYRKAEGKSSSHLRDLEYKLNKFVTDHTGRFVSEFDSKGLAEWLLKLKCEQQTRLNYKRVIHNLFAFCKKQGYCSTNPAEGCLDIKVPPSNIGIFTPKQLQSLLTHAKAEVVPSLVIGCFAGLRREEIARLDWKDVNLTGNFIEVKASKTKTAQRRLVTISDNLHAWLLLHHKSHGALRPSEAIYRNLVHDAIQDSKIVAWPHNVLRHSFASHHLAQFSNAALTALELGHTESNTLFRHYRELVTKESAEEYWKIMPA